MKQAFERLVVQLIATVAGAVLLLLRLSWRINVKNPESGHLHMQNEVPRIFLFWHNRQLMMPAFYQSMGGKPRRMCALISRHRDGQIIAKALRLHGYNSVPGSSTRGGVSALIRLQSRLQNGLHLAITPDGPRGPLHKVKIGAVGLARATGAIVVPIAGGAKRKWELKSWDRLQIPKPFASVNAILGEPLQIPSDVSDQELSNYATTLEERLMGLNSQVDG